MTEQQEKPTESAEMMELDRQAESRREVLRKIGKFSVYVTPVMIGMLSKDAMAAGISQA